MKITWSSFKVPAIAALAVLTPKPAEAGRSAAKTKRVEAGEHGARNTNRPILTSSEALCLCNFGRWVRIRLTDLVTGSYLEGFFTIVIGLPSETLRSTVVTARLHMLAVATSVLLVALRAVPAAAGQAETQIWGDVTLDWIKSHRLTLGADIEPKVLVSRPADVPGWATLDVTPSVEYTRGNWLDVVGELLVARTKQTDDVNSTEITPRLGFRFHFLSNVEKRPTERKAAQTAARRARFSAPRVAQSLLLHGHAGFVHISPS